MTEVPLKDSVSASASASANLDVYDPDDVGLRDSPPLRQMRINLKPSPSPPPTIHVSRSPDFSNHPGPPGRKGTTRSKNRPSHGDAVLVAFMDGGKHPDLARKAGNEPLASDDEESEGSIKGTEIGAMAEREGESSGVDLTALAADALRAHEGQTAQDSPQPAQNMVPITNRTPIPNGNAIQERPVEDTKPALPSMTATYIRDSHTQSPSQMMVRSESMNSQPAGELPPIRRQSPVAGVTMGNGAGPVTLPSISDQLGDISHLEPGPAGEQTFSQSPPAGIPRPRFTSNPGQASPPKSPNTTFRRELPSPGHGPTHPYFYNPNHQRPPQADGLSYSGVNDYGSGNPDTPGPDQSGLIPVMPIDRMSIDGITNPQIGGFKCSYPGCTAQPFQTHYLLNSHANVHSSVRPHYCTVKGCPRSEGGKGFKRKNEMIRHGLVHESPGYVCPFCPDREHKYPRPDNLQRHVRVHHVDKDKDDPQLREVLSQRPEGPSRGRRRRGGPSS